MPLLLKVLNLELQPPRARLVVQELHAPLLPEVVRELLPAEVLAEVQRDGRALVQAVAPPWLPHVSRPSVRWAAARAGVAVLTIIVEVVVRV